MLKLHVIQVSTRPGRAGAPVARWFADFAKRHAAAPFEVCLVDLAEVALPLFDEPEHPSQRKYQHDHTKRWSALVDEADAFVFVTPEYNYNAPPSLVNALNYLVQEWAFKPVGFCSYGGASGGLRSVESVKPLIASLRMMPIPEGVAIARFTQQIADDIFTPESFQEQAAKTLLNALHRWAQALAPMRR